MPLRACPGNTNTGLRIAVVQQYQVLQYCTGLWWETIPFLCLFAISRKQASSDLLFTFHFRKKKILKYFGFVLIGNNYLCKNYSML